MKKASMITTCKKLFFRGLFSLIPILLTVYLIRFIVSFLSEWLFPLRTLLGTTLQWLPYREIIIAIVIVTGIGLIITMLSLDKLITVAEDALFRNIPLVGSIYFGIKKISRMIYKKDDDHEKNQEELVAWVRLPYKQAFCLGFMTGKLPKEIAPSDGKKYFCFFIPSTPNPISGYYIIAAEGEFFLTPLTRQEALSMVISGGILKPEEK